jgi:hypothetical protein
MSFLDSMASYLRGDWTEIAEGEKRLITRYHIDDIRRVLFALLNSGKYSHDAWAVFETFEWLSRGYGTTRDCHIGAATKCNGKEYFQNIVDFSKNGEVITPTIVEPTANAVQNTVLIGSTIYKIKRRFFRPAWATLSDIQSALSTGGYIESTGSHINSVSPTAVEFNPFTFPETFGQWGLGVVSPIGWSQEVCYDHYRSTSSRRWRGFVTGGWLYAESPYGQIWNVPAYKRLPFEAYRFRKAILDSVLGEEILSKEELGLITNPETLGPKLTYFWDATPNLGMPFLFPSSEDISNPGDYEYHFGGYSQYSLFFDLPPDSGQPLRFGQNPKYDGTYHSFIEMILDRARFDTGDEEHPYSDDKYWNLNQSNFEYIMSRQASPADYFFDTSYPYTDLDLLMALTWMDGGAGSLYANSLLWNYGGHPELPDKPEISDATPYGSWRATWTNTYGRPRPKGSATPYLMCRSMFVPKTAGLFPPVSSWNDRAIYYDIARGFMRMYPITDDAGFHVCSFCKNDTDLDAMTFDDRFYTHKATVASYNSELEELTLTTNLPWFGEGWGFVNSTNSATLSGWMQVYLVQTALNKVVVKVGSGSGAGFVAIHTGLIATHDSKEPRFAVVKEIMDVLNAAKWMRVPPKPKTPPGMTVTCYSYTFQDSLTGGLDLVGTLDSWVEERLEFWKDKWRDLEPFGEYSWHNEEETEYHNGGVYVAPNEEVGQEFYASEQRVQDTVYLDVSYSVTCAVVHFDWTQAYFPDGCWIYALLTADFGEVTSADPAPREMREKIDTHPNFQDTIDNIDPPDPCVLSPMSDSRRQAYSVDFRCEQNYEYMYIYPTCVGSARKRQLFDEFDQPSGWVYEYGETYRHVSVSLRAYPEEEWDWEEIPTSARGTLFDTGTTSEIGTNSSSSSKNTGCTIL